MRGVAIKCEGLEKAYGSAEDKVQALQSTNLTIYKNQLTLIIGPSGSGKTTLVSIIATILTPDAGNLIILDENIEGKTELEKAAFRCKNIGIVFQSFFLIPTLTIAENVALPLIVSGEEESVAVEKAIILLDKVHLAHRANVSPKLLSKGQQQKVAIARAMVNEAPIMICDEPTSSLDHISGEEVMKFLHNQSQDPNKAVLVVTHDPRIFPYADRIISMSDGQIMSEEIKK
jgi:putative ABC transport system ATP-binding protein